MHNIVASSDTIVPRISSNSMLLTVERTIGAHRAGATQKRLKSHARDGTSAHDIVQSFGRQSLTAQVPTFCKFQNLCLATNGFGTNWNC
eukprot:m.222084 g.222084  ORF g.222084 m.222084 type:complete len:89 (+) comp15621_c1_seq2:2734-3000(+)